MQVHAKEVKNKVQMLRKQGWSLGKIQKKFGLPKTTIYSWISDIKVSKLQQEKIRISALQALQEGREKAQAILRLQRIAKEQTLLADGIRSVGKLSHKELFIAGIALYWAEGFKNKHEHRLGFCNSDPAMIKFYLHWLEKCLSVKKQDIIARVTVNNSYKDKIEVIELYWSQFTEIPLSQFTKPFYQNIQWKKQFDQDNYHGVLRIHVKNSLDNLWEMKGWIEGLKQNLPG